MKIDPSMYVTVGHAAEIAGVSRHWMRQMAKAGALKAPHGTLVVSFDIDGQWFVLRSAAESFERHPTAGRPRVSSRTKKPE